MPLIYTLVCCSLLRIPEDLKCIILSLLSSHCRKIIANIVDHLLSRSLKNKITTLFFFYLCRHTSIIDVTIVVKVKIAP